MESRAKLLGHPVHPMLIVLPLGLFIGAVVFDALSIWRGNVILAAVGFWNIAGGVIGGLLAAVFGLIDWFAIPSGTRAKRIGLLHGASNVVVVAAFAVAWLMRRNAGTIRALFDTPFDYEAFAARDGLIGHGGIVVFDDSVDMAKQARFAMEFCAVESCGKCTPCRIGSTRGVETIDRIIRGERTSENLAVVEDLCNTMKFGSLCALGGFTPYPVMSALKHFREDFGPAPATLQAAE